MEIIRKVVNGNDLAGIIEMPDSFVDKKLEILVFPFEEKKSKKRKSIAGILSEYANTDLVEKEENVWYEEVEDE